MKRARVRRGAVLAYSRACCCRRCGRRCFVMPAETTADVREGPDRHAVEGHSAQQRHRREPHPQGGDSRSPGRDRRG